jgi:hypothetical protein
MQTMAHSDSETLVHLSLCISYQTLPLAAGQSKNQFAAAILNSVLDFKRILINIFGIYRQVFSKRVGFFIYTINTYSVCLGASFP